jgi:hypothetical protein
LGEYPAANASLDVADESPDESLLEADLLRAYVEWELGERGQAVSRLERAIARQRKLVQELSALKHGLSAESPPVAVFEWMIRPPETPRDASTVLRARLDARAFADFVELRQALEPERQRLARPEFGGNAFDGARKRVEAWSQETIERGGRSVLAALNDVVRELEDTTRNAELTLERMRGAD